jgi:hypothetical protein
MPGITAKERQKISHELKNLGFGGIDDPNLFAQIATLYPSHDTFRGLLLSTAPDQRRIAYEALRPHLMFTPKPLDVYEMEIKQRAEREQWDVWDGSPYPKPFKVPEISLDDLAQDAIRQNLHEKEKGLHLTCGKCTAGEVFRATNRKDAERDSHRAGWRSDGQKNWCPKCVPSRCTMSLQCVKCEQVQRIRAWDPQDGYASARLRGWVIADDATCPECAVKKIVLLQ